eukprot:TRINITY_DN10429_c0_g1_i1.p1 TRINITY_DN10429_c0_g1~~TRINITY_DN10429_c0_g1_i1.p1  ORF type:complete len:157 (+),score=43.07 TRINITY_DN10429_c0_g1_i1:266-736(+)
MTSCRDYGGGMLSKGWQTGKGPNYEIGELDEEVEKQLDAEELPQSKESSLQQLQEKGDQEFQAALSEVKMATPGKHPQVAAAAAVAVSAAAKRRELPKMLQIRKKENGTEATKDEADGTPAKRPCPEKDVRASPEQTGQTGGLLCGYASGSSSEDE